MTDLAESNRQVHGASPTTPIQAGSAPTSDAPTRAPQAEAPAASAGDEERWLAAWFRAQNDTLADCPDEAMARADYFAAQYIDSFGVVMLISEIESHFGMRFSERDFQDRRFSTVSGLADIIRERKTA